MGTVIGSVQRRIEGDLERFKKFIETRGQETGAWRGDVAPPPQTGASAPPQREQTGGTGTANPADHRAPRGGTSGSSVPPTGPDQ